MKIAVIGVGQSLRGDDAAGLEVVQRWKKEFPETANRPEVCVKSTETSGLELLDLFDGVDAAVLVDAVKSTAEPGTLHRLDPDNLAPIVSDSQSSHGWGVAEILRLSRQLAPSLKKLPVRLVGIEAEQMDFGAGLSQAVKQVMSSASRIVQEEVLLLLSS